MNVLKLVLFGLCDGVLCRLIEFLADMNVVLWVAVLVLAKHPNCSKGVVAVHTHYDWRNLPIGIKFELLLAWKHSHWRASQTMRKVSGCSSLALTLLASLNFMQRSYKALSYFLTVNDAPKDIH